jgi:hypothetical protein
MFTILQNVTHPETRETILHAGRALSETRINELADEFGFDPLPELLATGIVAPTKPPRNP